MNNDLEKLASIELDYLIDGTATKQQLKEEKAYLETALKSHLKRLLFLKIGKTLSVSEIHKLYNCWLNA